MVASWDGHEIDVELDRDRKKERKRNCVLSPLSDARACVRIRKLEGIFMYIYIYIYIYICIYIYSEA